MLIDTHAHIYLEDFSNDIDNIIQNAYNNNINKIILPNIDSSSVKHLLDLSGAYPHLCFPLMGLHPTSVNENYKKELEIVEYWFDKRKFYGVGEIGIDLYWDQTFYKQQQDAFRIQLKIAKSKNIPVVIHTRNSLDIVCNIVKEEQGGSLNGIFHCFSGNLEDAKKIINLGFLIGVGGVITFKQNSLANVIEKIDLKNIVLETDAPYLTPVPKRGKRNESSYIIYVAHKVAEIYKIPIDKVAEVTTANACSLFAI
ncbi:MAG: TatD family hydrolase [Bacteroidales bacterium]|jgi:TatD DNase family protein|nr:TatD family hydrolase [Bacteroidales bacterium]